MKNKFKLILFIVICFIVGIKSSYAEEVSISYNSHVQNIGWQGYVKNDELSGTTGRALQMEAIIINIEGDPALANSIRYQAHVQNIGWQNYVKNGQTAGTTGRGLRLEAIKIELTGDMKDKYNIYYQAHVSCIGWQNYVKNGEIAGTTGRSISIEALRIKIVKKGAPLNLKYKSNIEKDGWQDYVNNGLTSGTTGEAKAMKKINMHLENFEGDINEFSYSVYNEKTKWQDYVSMGKDAGYDNQNIEAIKIRLTGELVKYYDVYYRTHVSSIGWLDWTKNDAISGNIGYFKAVEAIEIKLVEKNDTSIKVGQKTYVVSNNSISYSSHIENIGWQSYVKNGVLSGTEGKALRMEALKMKMDTLLSGNILYQTYIDGKGWQGYVKNNQISGTTGQSKKIEAIKIKLDGEILNYYDVYYRTHISSIGWSGWAKNNEPSGCLNSNTQIEAIEIKLMLKNNNKTEKNAFFTGKWVTSGTDKKYSDYFGKYVTDFRVIDGVKYYFNSEGTLIGEKVKKVIDVSSWQNKIDWDTIKRKGDVDKVILRVGWGTSISDKCGLDNYFDYNIKSLQRLKIPYDIYIYAYAKVNTAAEKEAKFVYDTIKKYNVPKDTYIWYDAELDYSKDIYESVIPVFVNKMKSYGYSNVGVYSNLNRFISTSGGLNSNIIKSYPLWVAQYYKKIQYPGKYLGWQYTSTGSIEGITGNVDISMFY